MVAATKLIFYTHTHTHMCVYIIYIYILACIILIYNSYTYYINTLYYNIHAVHVTSTDPIDHMRIYVYVQLRYAYCSADEKVLECCELYQSIVYWNTHTS
jgi:hypothetical protein